MKYRKTIDPKYEKKTKTEKIRFRRDEDGWPTIGFCSFSLLLLLLWMDSSKIARSDPDLIDGQEQKRKKKQFNLINIKNLKRQNNNFLKVKMINMVMMTKVV